MATLTLLFFFRAESVTLPKQSKGSVGGQVCLMLIVLTGVTVVSHMMRLAHSEQLTSLFEYEGPEMMLEFLMFITFEIFFFCLPQA